MTDTIRYNQTTHSQSQINITTEIIVVLNYLRQLAKQSHDIIVHRNQFIA